MNTIKKYIPIFMIIFTLVIYFKLLGSVDNQELDASPSTPSKSINRLLDDLFSKTTFITTENKKIRLNSLISPVVIIHFWASWCVPSIEEMQGLIKLKHRFGDDEVVIIDINSDITDQKSKIRDRIKLLEVKHPVVADRDGYYVQLFSVNRLPHTVIYSNKKKIEVSTKQKDFSSKEFITFIKGAIQQNSGPKNK